MPIFCDVCKGVVCFRHGEQPATFGNVKYCDCAKTLHEAEMKRCGVK